MFSGFLKTLSYKVWSEGLGFLANWSGGQIIWKIFDWSWPVQKPLVAKEGTIFSGFSTTLKTWSHTAWLKGLDFLENWFGHRRQTISENSDFSKFPTILKTWSHKVGAEGSNLLENWFGHRRQIVSENSDFSGFSTTLKTWSHKVWSEGLGVLENWFDSFWPVVPENSDWDQPLEQPLAAKERTIFSGFSTTLKTWSHTVWMKVSDLLETSQKIWSKGLGALENWFDSFWPVVPENIDWDQPLEQPLAAKEGTIFSGFATTLKTWSHKVWSESLGALENWFDSFRPAVPENVDWDQPLEQPLAAKEGTIFSGFATTLKTWSHKVWSESLGALENWFDSFRPAVSESADWDQPLEQPLAAKEGTIFSGFATTLKTWSHKVWSESLGALENWFDSFRPAVPENVDWDQPLEQPPLAAKEGTIFSGFATTLKTWSHKVWSESLGALENWFDSFRPAVPENVDWDQPLEQPPLAAKEGTIFSGFATTLKTWSHKVWSESLGALENWFDSFHPSVSESADWDQPLEQPPLAAKEGTIFSGFATTLKTWSHKVWSESLGALENWFDSFRPAVPENVDWDQPLEQPLAAKEGTIFSGFATTLKTWSHKVWSESLGALENWFDSFRPSVPENADWDQPLEQPLAAKEGTIFSRLSTTLKTWSQKVWDKWIWQQHSGDSEEEDPYALVK